MRPWDSSNDLLQYEQGYKIQTWTRHRTPVVRTCSITSLEQKPDTYPVRKIVSRNCSLKNKTLHVVEESESSTPEIENGRQDSDSSEPNKSMWKIAVFIENVNCKARTDVE